MAFTISPATGEDLEAAKSIYDLDDGGFTAPLTRICWPIPDDLPERERLDHLRRRAEWSLQHQIEVLQHDPCVRLMKATDSKTRELVCIACWQFFENGYQILQPTQLSACAA
jgi:hypothetical protein